MTECNANEKFLRVVAMFVNPSDLVGHNLVGKTVKTEERGYI